MIAPASEGLEKFDKEPPTELRSGEDEAQKFLSLRNSSAAVDFDPKQDALLLRKIDRQYVVSECLSSSFALNQLCSLMPIMFVIYFLQREPAHQIIVYY